MAGGKKKNLANRLAKMSDEERARYMQRKADVEEEAKKRKEQLISTFLKNKIKKEDGFSRLNLAKINQQWHQILRVNKCKQMKDAVEHMKEYIERILHYKNRTIAKLMEEIEMAEEQYAHNFQCHVTHIDRILDQHNIHLARMNSEFQQDLALMAETSRREREEYVKNAADSRVYLKSVIFGQITMQKKWEMEAKERCLKKREDLSSSAFVRHREAALSAIWQQIAEALCEFTRRTDARRLHFAELRRIDAESAAEIANNQERIHSQQVELEELSRTYEEMQTERSEKIAKLEKRLKVDSCNFFQRRKQLRSAVERDDSVLVVLTKNSAGAINKLAGLMKRGEQILAMMDVCKKLETEKERLVGFWPKSPEIDAKTPEKQEKKETIQKIVISTKSSSLEEDPVDPCQLLNKFAHLMHLQNFWQIFNQANVDLILLRKEKTLLQEENKRLRQVLRSVLETAVLQGRASTAPPTKRVFV